MPYFYTKVKSFFYVYLSLDLDKVCRASHIYLLIIYMSLCIFLLLLFRREKARDRPSNDLKIFTNVDHIEPYMKYYPQISKNFFLYILAHIFGYIFVSKLLDFFYGENYKHRTIWDVSTRYDFHGDRYRESWKIEEDEEEDSEEEEDNDIFSTEIWDDGEVEAAQGASPYSTWVHDEKLKPFYMYEYDFVMKYRDYLKDDIYVRTYYHMLYKDYEPLNPEIVKAVHKSEDKGFLVNNFWFIRLLKNIFSFISKIIKFFFKLIFYSIFILLKTIWFLIKQFRLSNIVRIVNIVDWYVKRVLNQDFRHDQINLDIDLNFYKKKIINYIKHFINIFLMNVFFYYKVSFYKITNFTIRISIKFMKIVNKIKKKIKKWFKF